MTGFPIVGIGASAGGIEALEGFFRGVPAAPGVAFVVVTHLSPDRESRLHEIISRYTTLPVHIAADGLQIETNTVYVMPAGAILGISRSCLSLRKPDANRRERKPIDIFFSALAMDQGELAAGVVLSGGDGDGTLGVKAIKERGGLTFAQSSDGYGPHYPDMPDNAIASGLVDFALPADQMGAKLVECARSLEPIADDDDETPPAADGARAVADAQRDIYAILRNRVGHDFSGYKAKTFLRRVQRRMQVRQIPRVGPYVDLLREDPKEVAALFRDLLINVTNFFRDPEAFAKLAEIVVPKLFEDRGADDTVRVWVPGCATGEEAYTLAMLLREHMDRLSTTPRVQIFATDIDERALGIARTGRYTEALLEGVSAERRDRFFTSEDGFFAVSKDLRDLCVFSPHSVIRDPPFSRIDLISCRNLLIYFGLDVQSRVVPIFHYALNPDGFLFLGSSENVGQFSHLFAPLVKNFRIFRRRADVTPAIRLPMAIDTLRPGHALPRGAPKSPLSGATLRQAVESQVLEQFSPPYVVVNREGEVIYYSARTGKYLEAAPGVPTPQILSMARKGLRLDLRTTFRETLDTGRAATTGGIAVEMDDGRVQMLTLTVVPLEGQGASDQLFLVMFMDDGPMLSREQALGRHAILEDGNTAHLERELRDTRERLQSLIEEYETALEELKASNEELVSVNEEMQSSNEELEASKEELQSVNEELHTVNGELNIKIEALDQANSDLKNLFESTDVATIFLDRKMMIRSFTPAATKVFSILPADRGRSIADFYSRLRMPDFEEDARLVLAEGRSIDRRVTDEQNNADYLVRLVPYLNSGKEIEGLIASFVNVTTLTESERRQQVLIAELQHRTRNLLTVVQVIARQTVGQGLPLESFTSRVAALGRVQGLIGQASRDQVDLAEIVRLELKAHAALEDDRVTVAGPSVRLNLEQVQVVALVLHELTTNAVKHGALSDHGGHLDVLWDIEREGPSLVLDWKESGVSVPPDPSHQGYGRELIERAVAFTLQAKTELTFGQDGISYRIEVPLPRASHQSNGADTTHP
ncbi:two-component system CheB/CheR fusion protein [Humitalea rosea]|uniref:histidine kinase n=1 Tax=Humitalea rosea TaxID=990373 RepID=A0A2W7KK54_9PROT|nr:CheR family methyltransferase [Humitalea rosea]PZW48429.1 two-component system CheB/CheR fusion protein [Humitalea rosea]